MLLETNWSAVKFIISLYCVTLCEGHTAFEKKGKKHIRKILEVAIKLKLRVGYLL